MKENAVIESFEEVTELAAPVRTSLATTDTDTYFCSMPVTSRQEALQLADALSNTEPLSDHMGEELHMHNYIVQACEVNDRETGEIRAAKRIILMCDEGNFGTISSGVENSMRNITDAMKMYPAPWDEPIAFKAVTKGKKPREFTSLELVL